VTELELYKTDNQALRKKLLVMQNGCMQAIFRLNDLLEWGNGTEQTTAEIIKQLLMDLPGVRPMVKQAEAYDADLDRQMAEARRAGR
jgi:DNA-directed RNA polymerase sigma subunit (sigma70/sigma32)